MAPSARGQKVVLSLAMASVGVHDVRAYTVAVPYTKPASIVLTIPNAQLDAQPSFSSTHSKQQGKGENTADEAVNSSPTPRSSYDLGLGKNAPVPHLASTAVSLKGEVAPDADQVTQYWSEHEAAREYPSPLSQETGQFEKADASPAEKPRKAAFINYERALQDSLTILHEESDKPATVLPVMIQSDPSESFDMNTMWVEMLLHSEQLKHAAAN